MDIVGTIKRQSLPWWTWIAPYALYLATAFLSVSLKSTEGSLLVYLPIPISLILIHWWGPRVLPGIYLAALTRYIIVDRFSNDPLLSLFMATHVPMAALSSWWLFTHVAKGKKNLPDIENVAKFFIAGIFIPVTINALYEIWIHPDLSSTFVEQIKFVWIADFASSCTLTVPALFFLTPYLAKCGLVLSDSIKSISFEEIIKGVRSKGFEILSLTIGITIITSVLAIERYWYVSGVLVVFIALRFGFGFALMANLVVFVLSYMKPFLYVAGPSLTLNSGFIEIHQGMCLLSVTAAIIGRVVSDLRNTEKQLHLQNTELKQAHAELDRFVYSASHDLSAPLKSILGLINISRIEPDIYEKVRHLDKIEKSVLKLEGFIQEILDYSRNSRLSVKPEPIRLKELIEDVLENLRYAENFKLVKFHLTDLEVDTVVTDRMRLRIILNNIISNAVRYHKLNDPLNKPRVIIRSHMNHKAIKIHVQDNGTGIREDSLDKIFTMFYRGTITSTGSGLGLYIAKEAAEKINGTITVQSVYGLGSNFTIHIPKEVSTN